ncbi:MAG TPA: hypothetical protein VKE49_09010, partial [Myxococcaceae bacterium]|nr:hypothetical protein [Myxococcaceae bacterium]
MEIFSPSGEYSAVRLSIHIWRPAWAPWIAAAALGAAPGQATATPLHSSEARQEAPRNSVIRPELIAGELNTAR